MKKENKKKDWNSRVNLIVKIIILILNNFYD